MSDLNPPLQTSRMLLEPLMPEHAFSLHKHLVDERLYRYIPIDPPESVEAVRQRYQKLALRRSPSGDEIWLNWIMKDRVSGEYVGTLEATVLPDARAMIAYMVFPEFWRMGFALEGGREVVYHLWKTFPVDRIFGEVDTRNIPSCRLLESLGFSRVGYRENVDFFKGDRSDEYSYELVCPAHLQCSSEDECPGRPV